MLACSCSNPFSSQSASILRENAKPQNTNCNDVRFDQSELSAKQFRAVIHCLNQNKDLEEIELWSRDISDAELSPWIIQFNSILKNEPEFLYGLKQIYLDQHDQGVAQDFLTQLLSRIRLINNADGFVSLIKNHSFWIRSFISDPRYSINTQKLSLLSSVKSFGRGVDEIWKTGRLIPVLDAIHRYHHDNSALSFQELYKFFGNTSPQVIADQDSVEKISGMINWLLSENRLETFSRAAETLSQKPISCFQNGKTVTAPLDILFSELMDIRPNEAPDFFRKRVPALLLLAQPYCNIPQEVLSAATLLQQSAELNALPTFFAFSQPLLKNGQLVSLLASLSFRQLGKDLSSINDTHFFQDLITLINWFQKNQVSESNTALFLDSLFDEFSSQEIYFFININPSDAQFFQTAQEIIQSLPKLKTTPSLPVTQDWLAPFAKDSFGPALLLLSRMNDEKKIIPIIDRMTELFQKMLDRGKNSYQKPVITEPIHSSSTSSQNWQVSFLKNTPTKPASDIYCGNVLVNWSFEVTKESFSKEAYLRQLDQLAACYGTNQSFVSVRDLAQYLINTDPSGTTMAKFNSIQNDLLNFAFGLDYDLSFDSFSHFLDLNDHDRTQVHHLITSGSELVRQVKPLLETATGLRSLVGKYVARRTTFDAILKQNDYRDHNERNSILEKDPVLISIVLNGLPDLFKQYCPDLNSGSSKCMIEADQVRSYQQTPQKLADEIVTEYLSSQQSWAHPLEFKVWSHSSNQLPKTVSTFEYHLNPLLKQTETHRAPMDGIFDFLLRNEKSDTTLLSFLTEKSRKFFLIPYIFQNPDYPESRSEEYHHLIRLRLVSDLDRLELLAINTDFKPFGLMKNFGLNSLREIAISWGDVSPSERPSLGSAETLQMARTSILNQFSRFNLSLLQHFGRSGALGDIRARMFNLKSLLPVLDDEKELAFLRDLFYSLYEQNSDQQIGIYSNGVKESPECLSPDPISNNHCQRDLLNMIPHIARLGLLHQSGLSLWNGNTETVKTVIAILSNSNHEKKSSEISSFISSPPGQTSIRDILTLLQNLGPSEQESIAALLENFSAIRNQEWLTFALAIIETYPKIIFEYSPVIHSILSDTKIKPLAPELIDLLSLISIDLSNKQVGSEAAKILAQLSTTQNSLQTILHIQLSTDMSVDWLKLLAKPENQKYRDQISSFITGKGFDNFCDVSSDAIFAEKAYIFLENSHQNSGVSDLLQECRRFLH